MGLKRCDRGRVSGEWHVEEDSVSVVFEPHD